MKKQFKRKLKLKKSVQFKLIQLMIIALSVMLMVASFKDASSSVINYKFNWLMTLAESFLIIGVICLEDFVK